ncbi:paraquat-inducible protein A [Pelagicoccus sp. SDUM812005]|uniref:paraquat-inducible protein A n=1 Tax=Pelagicoccus sp. SDUM812005 TaxID=3041257 RepID=UPI00280C5CFD|nr:paraquat-inducible protein A [Pelagicoccus sp. SDUM812005]MDQ8182426.1 paraquat-inducible protein A [Pelagicoccus sp. SDUM812005]
MAPSKSSSTLPYAIAALACWGFALYFPLAEVQKLNLSNSSFLLSIGSAFRAKDQLLLGLCVDVLAVAIPSLLFLLLPLAAAPSSTPLRKRCLQLLGAIKTWAMPEVFALSILIAFIKLGSLAEASIAPGFYFLSLATLLLIYLLQRLPIPEPPHRKSRPAALAYLLAACLLLVPANALPIMTVSTAQGHKSSTIIAGVANLAEHGLWGIAAVVFVASILVPFGKLGGLAWLLFLSHKNPDPSFQGKLYRFIDFIGRWSMLDIFLIGVLASLIEFGSLASISPGPAAPAFAAAVILTIIAVERFPLKQSS